MSGGAWSSLSAARSATYLTPCVCWSMASKILSNPWVLTAVVCGALSNCFASNGTNSWQPMITTSGGARA